MNRMYAKVIGMTAAMAALATALILLVILLCDSAEAETLMYECHEADRGATPVIIYIEGSGWEPERTIIRSELYDRMNMILVRSLSGQYNFSSAWRAEDRAAIADQILGIMRDRFPEAKAVVNITYSMGGCMAEALYEQCEAQGIETACAVMMDSVYRKYPPEGMQRAGVPIMYAISETNRPTHITGWTREWLRQTGKTGKEYGLNHGQLPADREVQKDVYQFIIQAEG